ncbi:hypothetical protein EYF80_019277 [Liparis tanakae]|uniref:Uncharacterized protein n=1 Tax=Liparis tanakae TaxID=230148 RepID=A0A4Z2HZZ1_9TELE|nr:hypothetical protein EYF80_019277 [Liparis tanakae]
MKRESEEPGDSALKMVERKKRRGSEAVWDRELAGGKQRSPDVLLPSLIIQLFMAILRHFQIVSLLTLNYFCSPTISSFPSRFAWPPSARGAPERINPSAVGTQNFKHQHIADFRVYAS